ncbi:AIR synthase family protein [Halanaerobium salsuginis]|uniref:Hydrogenase maturation factor n=1 Tax=Halanaerobium salsuginis TaxID=29563 RepID=A0A1I4I7W6_9FIRM|nr:AIR synthase family protein [Halanaerobium salsuginis]SFL49871.1 Hydrogenase maturation factor [Halanaerobium salsuginis]
MEIGKLAGRELKQVILNKIDHFRSDILVPAGIGEDSAVVDIGDSLLVVSSDPITGATNKAGFLAVNVSCNDIAAAGAEPFGIQVILMLPPELGTTESENLMQEIVDSAKKLGVEVLGGHTEITDLVKQPIITITALGRAAKGELAATSAARSGDILYISKGMGIEGSYILANDYPNLLLKNGVSQAAIDSVLNFINQLSVLPESRLARQNGVKAMHDVTEGGVYGAIAEMASAANLGFLIEKDNFVPHDSVVEICTKLDLDPAGLISSGSLLMAAPPELDLEAVFANSGIDIFRVGKLLSAGNFIVENGQQESFELPEQDELWNFIEKNYGNS